MTDKKLRVPTDVLKRIKEHLKNDLSTALRSQENRLNKNFDDEILAMTAEGLEMKKLMIKKQRELLESLSNRVLGLEGLMPLVKRNYDR